MGVWVTESYLEFLEPVLKSVYCHLSCCLDEHTIIECIMTSGLPHFDSIFVYSLISPLGYAGIKADVLFSLLDSVAESSC